MFAPVPTTRPCPNCKSEMTATKVTPLFFFDGLDEVTYRCAKCSIEIKRTFSHASVLGSLSA